MEEIKRKAGRPKGAKNIKKESKVKEKVRQVTPTKIKPDSEPYAFQIPTLEESLRRIEGDKKVEEPKPIVKEIPTLEESLQRIEQVARTTSAPIVEESQPKQAVPSQLSFPAQKWQAYLKLQGQTAEQFLLQYKTHRHRHLIEEIYAFEQAEKNKKEKSLDI